MREQDGKWASGSNASLDGCSSHQSFPLVSSFVCLCYKSMQIWLLWKKKKFDVVAKMFITLITNTSCSSFYSLAAVDKLFSVFLVISYTYSRYILLLLYSSIFPPLSVATTNIRHHREQRSAAFPCFDLAGFRHYSDRYPTMQRPVFTTAKLRDAISWS